jgi:zinc ribbon protein
MALVRCSECGEMISDRAVACPRCGAPGRGAPAMGMGYELRFPAGDGVPLLHIATGMDPATGRKRIAKGIIAIGDVAVGVIALGGVAVGGLSLGGLSLGVLALGGLSLGVGAALGGVAIGSVAVGGAAFGYYAMGGGAFGAHILCGWRADPEAVRFFRGLLGR